VRGRLGSGALVPRRVLGPRDPLACLYPQAQKLGINAILSSPLLTEECPVGALNIYSRTRAACSEKEQRLAALYATEASICGRCQPSRNSLVLVFLRHVIP
jgi:hypothetical protein